MFCVTFVGRCGRNNISSTQVETLVFCIRLFRNIISGKKLGQRMGSCIKFAYWTAAPILSCHVSSQRAANLVNRVSFCDADLYKEVVYSQVSKKIKSKRFGSILTAMHHEPDATNLGATN